MSGDEVITCNLFNNSGISIPFNLLNTLFTVYDHFTKKISYFMREEDINEERLSFI